MRSTDTLQKLCTTFFCCLLGLAAAFLLILNFLPHEIAGFNTEQVYELDGNCFAVAPDGSEIPITLPASTIFDENKTTTIRFHIPEELTSVYALCIRTSHQEIEAVYDGELVYSFGKDKGKIPFGLSPGSAWNIIRLPQTSAGNDVYITLTAINEYYAGHVNTIYAGTKAAILFHLVGKTLPNFLLCTLILLTGCALLVLSLILRKIFSRTTQLQYLGCFAVLVALWLLSESKTAQFFISNQQVVYFGAFLSLSLFIVPVLQYIASIPDYHYRRLTHSMALYICADTLIIAALQLFNVVQYYEVLPFVNTVRIIVTIIAIITLLLERLKHHNKSATDISLGLIIISIAGILEYAKFVFARSLNVGQIFIFGLLLFIIILAQSAIRYSLRMSNLSRQAQRYEILAKKDLMTKAFNRTAYIEDLAEINLAPGWKNYIAVVVDVNELKEINDTHGHHIGDDAIVQCYQVLADVFGLYGNCYRIGGDEFVVLIDESRHADLKLRSHFEDYRNAFYRCCKNKSRTVTYPFFAALGMSAYTAEDSCVQDIVNRADLEMYAQKARFRA